MTVDYNGPDSTSGGSVEPFLVGATPSMRKVRQLVQVAAARGCDVLVVGDPGTGKELVARAVHARSGRDGHFHKVEATSPPGVLDIELFGPKLDQSTVFLREVADLSLAQQEKLRHALEARDRQERGAESGEGSPLFSGVQLICSSARDLAAETREGTFDVELYRRLQGFVIDLPPLNARRDDIPLLLEHFLRLLRREIGHPVERFSPAAVEVLVRRSWAGNVRELYDYVRTTVILSSAKVVQPMDLWAPRTLDDPGNEPWHVGYRVLRKRVLLRFEADFVARVLHAASGNVSMAARLAKIDRKHLWRLIQRTGMRLEKCDK